MISLEASKTEMGRYSEKVCAKYRGIGINKQGCKGVQDSLLAKFFEAPCRSRRVKTAGGEMVP
jgi:hypothetical protein